VLVGLEPYAITDEIIPPVGVRIESYVEDNIDKMI
jgi:hypothetical protein